VELSPGDLAARAQLALVLARAGRRDDAARRQAEVDQMRADSERVTALIEGPLQARPDDPAVPHEIAQIALRAGQVGEALRWFEAALRADPDHAPTHRVLAALHHELGNPALSARHRALAQRAARPKS
jgi:Flp pilus assembly protein TadD